MNNRYKSIIREEIERYILSESPNVLSLKPFIPSLSGCSTTIANIGSTNNTEIDKFLKDLVQYILQVVFGIKRCIDANSLNESGFGMNIPAELGGNFFRDFEKGFNIGSRWAAKKLGYGNNASGYGNGNGRNTVPSVKLADSLSKLANFEAKYRNLESKYNNAISKVSQAPLNAFTELKKLQRQYNQLNAQGNP